MPKEKVTEAASGPAPEPTTAAEFEKRAIVNNQAQAFKAGRMGVPTAVLPGGIREDATPYMFARYEQADESKVLSDAESIVSENFKREHPGWHYEWPLKGSNRTQSYIRAGRYKPVPFEAINQQNPYAMVAPSPEGATVWHQHQLVAVPPEVWQQEKEGPENYAKARTAQTRASMEAEIGRNFRGFKGEWEPLDVRKER